MTKLKHSEFQTTKQQITSSFDPTNEPNVVIPFASDGWDGLYIGFSIVGLAAYFELAVPAFPLIIGGSFIATLFIIHKTISMLNTRKELIEHLESLDKKIITKNHFRLWRETIPKLRDGKNRVDIKEYLLNSSPDKMLIELAKRYRRINALIEQELASNQNAATLQ
ncbi:MAG: hypothetical protein M3R00_08520, partial [Pseudomonadota bacterium]|nr:hypothetical protein [Pseudomonadota bacterium]